MTNFVILKITKAELPEATLNVTVALMSESTQLWTLTLIDGEMTVQAELAVNLPGDTSVSMNWSPLVRVPEPSWT